MRGCGTSVVRQESWQMCRKARLQNLPRRSGQSVRLPAAEHPRVWPEFSKSVLKSLKFHGPSSCADSPSIDLPVFQGWR